MIFYKGYLTSDEDNYNFVKITFSNSQPKASVFWLLASTLISRKHFYHRQALYFLSIDWYRPRNS